MSSHLFPEPFMEEWGIHLRGTKARIDFSKIKTKIGDPQFIKKSPSKPKERKKKMVKKERDS